MVQISHLTYDVSSWTRNFPATLLLLMFTGFFVIFTVFYVNKMVSDYNNTVKMTFLFKFWCIIFKFFFQMTFSFFPLDYTQSSQTFCVALQKLWIILNFYLLYFKMHYITHNALYPYIFATRCRKPLIIQGVNFSLWQYQTDRISSRQT